MNELPELDELVQVGLFNILEERDVQIRGYPVKFDIDVLILFSANPATYNRSGKVIPQLKDRIGSVIHTHYPRDRATGHRDHGAGGGGRSRRRVPRGGALLHAGDHRGDQRRRAEVEVHRPAVGRERPVQHRQLSGDGGQRPAAGGRAGRASGRAADQRPGTPLFHFAGQAGAGPDEQPPVDASGRCSTRSWPRPIRNVFDGYVDRHGLEEIAEIFSKGVKIEVGDMLPSTCYAERLSACRRPGKRPSRSTLPAVRRCGRRASSSCWPGCTPAIGFPAQSHGRIVYEIT